ncbi:formin-J isoform X1 [Zeugodacus cucurbitae]|uniref:formin-J isoform X1 n=2 Tax=Zeugodacus cucurbitae TaxID=28588 RepID=UPI0023D95CF1|nr:formin-J isoform X1 [Zeugodacus cucurbitae]XP_054090157.1 formin-J isoform X1 [Zeugodacus cucurbitae]XP_054090158.1 formin-J isoform X1 [Zeugodacus cucurbitae]XP_054090159.1 formin-J isoform X1 [Zeugodacus cucurbitae]
MSSSLMSCVRENSPPLDIVDGANCSSATGPMSLPDCHMSTMSTAKQQQLTSTPLSTPNINESSSSGGGGAGGGGDGTTQNTEPKRRRFHPLRNLRRIFRRRTITNVPDTPSSVSTTNTLPPPTSSTSEKNLRSATLSSISSAVSASSPSSPLTHQQLQDAYSSQSLPKSKSYSITAGGGNKATQHRDALLAAVLGGSKQHKQQQHSKQQLQQQLEEVTSPGDDMYTTHTTTSSMYHHHHHQQHQQVGSSGGVLFQPPHSVRQSLGVAVLPSAINRSFYAERQKLRSIGDSSQELDSSGNDSGSANNTANDSANGGRTNGCASSEMSDSQRSLSEGRLVDSDYSHDPLSQSHDSVFSESASASLFSNRDYQAELSDVLRKRNRHRQDASEEDLGLPRSPASPQRRVERTTQRTHHASSKHTTTTVTSSSATTGGNHSEVSSLSLLSMNSGDGDELFTASTANNSTISTKEYVQERSMTATSSTLSGRSVTRSSTVSTTSVSSEIYRHSSSGSLASDTTRDEPDLLGAKCQRLSHSAAKHKMALRPAKKKGPSRLHRRTLETSIPEANEDTLRLANNPLLDIKEHDIKAKTRSLPPSVNTKVLEQHAVESKKVASPSKSKTKSSNTSNEQMLNVKRTKIEKHEKTTESGKHTTNTTTVTTSSSSSSSGSISAATNLFGLRTLTAKATALFEPPQESSTDPTPSEQELKREKEREKLKEKEKEKLKEKEREKDAASSQMENADSGFLRRLIQRNSKRSATRSNNTNSNNSNTNNSNNSNANNSNPNNNSNTKNCAPAAVEKLDVNPSETDAKSKVQVSTSCLDVKATPEPSLTKLDKSRSALSYEQNIEETRKDIKREIMSVGSTGLNAMLNTHNLTVYNNSGSSVKEATPASSPQKPKSGAASRQRYLPQDIGSLERKLTTATNTTAHDSHASSTSSILSKCSQQEIFQSTSIIREITASQASSVNSLSSVSKLSEHHYEKKPKIVGLSAFQQKISRSNDSVVRYGSNAQSTNSLDAADETHVFSSSQEQKQRKVVEKSRSFRTYQEEAYATPTAVHNNMPSLPDLTLNLRVPYNDYTPVVKDNADVSVETQEEKVTRVNTTRSESNGNLHATSSNYNFIKNISVKSSPTKTNAITPNTDESNNNGELLVKSPFINVLRKPTSTTSLEEKPVVVTVSAANSNRKSVEQINALPKASPISLITVVPPTAAEVLKAEQPLRPKVLHLRDSNASIDTSTSTDELKLTPTTAAVPLREKSKLKSNVAVANVRNSMDILAANAKDVERKSAPAPVVQAQASKQAQCVKTTRRSTSLLDSPPAQSQNGSEERGGAVKLHDSTSGSSTPNDDGVPEFMRIQLNRVDPARIAKSANVVLAKNVREVQAPTQQQQQTQAQQVHQEKQQQQQQVTKEANNERNTNLEDLSLRRLSNESVEIVEKASPTEADKQKPIFDMSPTSNNNNNKSPTKIHVLVSALPPRSPIKKQQSIVTLSPTTPTTPPIEADESALLRMKSPDAPADAAATLSSKKLSLQERKRLFMSEEKLKTDKRIEELRNERKKSITEEVYRKSFAKSEEKLETSEKAACGESVVMMRKKSFCATTQACASTNGNRDDATPELMKVFARRSLKIKDEDINALADKIHISNGGGSGSGNSAKKFAATQQNVDSDKENQSASEEKLDKLPKLESSLELQSHVGGKLSNGVNNRNSLADFRTKSAVGGASPANGLSLNNNNNNNNHTAANNSTTGVVNNTTANNSNNGISSDANKRSFLPPIKVAGFRAIPIERNNSVSKIYPTTACETLNNNNNNNNSNSNNLNNNNHNHLQQQNGKTHERQSLNIKALECNSSGSSSSMNSSSSSNTSALTKTIERSATVSEFKGIHQRRAEWEQRAKEALK